MFIVGDYVCFVLAGQQVVAVKPAYNFRHRWDVLNHIVAAPACSSDPSLQHHSLMHETSWWLLVCFGCYWFTITCLIPTWWEGKTGMANSLNGIPLIFCRNCIILHFIFHVEVVIWNDIVDIRRVGKSLHDNMFANFLFLYKQGDETLTEWFITIEFGEESIISTSWFFLPCEYWTLVVGQNGLDMTNDELEGYFLGKMWCKIILLKRYKC